MADTKVSINSQYIKQNNQESNQLVKVSKSNQEREDVALKQDMKPESPEPQKHRTRRCSGIVYAIRALEVVLATAIMATSLGFAVHYKHIHNLLMDIGYSGPVIPLLAMFSNYAINRRSFEFPELLTVLILCLVLYLVGISGSIAAMPLIQINRSKFFPGQLFKMFLTVITCVIIVIDIVIEYLKKCGRW